MSARRASARVADAVRHLVAMLASVVVLVVLSPLLLVVAVAVRLTMGRGVLFRQRRIGRAGRPFELLKFRTMRDPVRGREAPEFDSERLTGLGRFLRASSIDELPSLVNVLKGDMVLVGPRPLPTHYWQRFRGDEFRRFEVAPGLTGLAQVSGRNTVDWPERLALDVRYVDERTLWGDLRIVVRTVPLVLFGRGVGHSEGVATMHELPVDR